MPSGNKCKVKDDLVNQLISLNSKLNTLSPSSLRSEQARNEVQEQREVVYVELKRHRKKGHDGKPCPAVQRYPLPSRKMLSSIQARFNQFDDALNSSAIVHSDSFMK